MRKLLAIAAIATIAALSATLSGCWWGPPPGGGGPGGGHGDGPHGAMVVPGHVAQS